MTKTSSQNDEKLIIVTSERNKQSLWIIWWRLVHFYEFSKKSPIFEIFEFLKNIYSNFEIFEKQSEMAEKSAFWARKWQIFASRLTRVFAA